MALDLLARREHSLSELRGKLAARGLPLEEIDTAVAALAREGLASDDRFLESFVTSRIRKGQGPIRIRAELRERGLDGETISRALADAHDWRALARDVRATRFGARPPADVRDRARQSRFLEYRGFTSEQIRAAFGSDEE